MNSITLLSFIVLIISFNSDAAAQKIYAWTDENGVLVFSDTPKAGAQEVKLTTQNLTMPATDTQILNDTQPVEPTKYGAMITAPEHNATVRENTGSVYVSTRITPRFENGYKIQLFFDGAAHAEPSNSTTFALRDVNRGEHSLQVKLFDPNNKLVSVSPVSTFFMHKASVNSGN
ncbi:DUF4124 domain-containing protein [Pseudoalteromonas mariniglutinosa]|uniref:DUF4124 domain-containing protein n=1 Tax=Pseudoalteromonas mariniglutinosa TaxID=206042 RepID=UPI003850C51F